MSVKVVCASCDSVVEVDGDSMGQQAQCPFCDQVFLVSPKSVAAPRPRTAVAPIGYIVGRNPLTNNEVSHGKLDASMAMRVGWDVLVAHLPTMFFCHTLFLAAGIVLSSIGLRLFYQGDDEATIFYLGMALLLVFIRIGAAGLTIMTLHVCRNKPVDIGVLLSGGNRLFRLALFNLLLTIVVGFGCIALIVPGIYLALRFWAGSYLIIDRDCKVTEAFMLSGKLTESNKAESLQLAIICSGFLMLGVSLFGVGVVLVYPLVNMAWTVAYLMVTRQPMERPQFPIPTPAK